MEYLDFFTNPFLFVAGSEVVDNLGTCYNCSINGSDQEGNLYLRNKIKEEGIIKGCLSDLPLQTLFLVGVTGVAAGLDYFLNINQSEINLTKAWAYGVGGVKYFNGVGHLLIGSAGAARLGFEGLVKKITRN